MHVSHDEKDLKLQVVRRTIVAADVVSLELEDPTGAVLPAWSPGAHLDLFLGPGLVRQYSLCGDEANPRRWRIATLLEPHGRGGSERVHQLAEGDLVDVRGPRNNFQLAPAPRYLFIAGGIGITPIIPMLTAAHDAGAAWELHYGGRTAASMAFAEHLAATYPDSVTLYPQDTTGLINLEDALGQPDADTQIYACGPEPLLRAVEHHSSTWPAGTLHLERFVPKHLDSPVRAGAFKVVLERSGITLDVPADQSVLDVVEAAGVPVASSCREGTCGTCETRVLGGTVEHRDSLLTEAEQDAGDVMFICVSRAAGPRLTLDL